MNELNSEARIVAEHVAERHISTSSPSPAPRLREGWGGCIRQGRSLRCGFEVADVRLAQGPVEKETGDKETGWVAYGTLSPLVSNCCYMW
jgi:hypothetical protein